MINSLIINKLKSHEIAKIQKISLKLILTRYTSEACIFKFRYLISAAQLVDAGFVVFKYFYPQSLYTVRVAYYEPAYYEHSFIMNQAEGPKKIIP